jgi:hypothetical protein
MLAMHMLRPEVHDAHLIAVPAMQRFGYHLGGHNRQSCLLCSLTLRRCSHRLTWINMASRQFPADDSQAFVLDHEHSTFRVDCAGEGGQPARDVEQPGPNLSGCDTISTGQ